MHACAASETELARLFPQAFDPVAPGASEAARAHEDAARLLTVAAAAEQARADQTRRAVSDWAGVQPR
jgi:hypothetical protein